MTHPAPEDPYANKAVIAALGTIVTVGLRWAISGEFTLSDEGVVALAGAIVSVLVFVVSNWKQYLGIGKRKDPEPAVVEGGSSHVRTPGRLP